MRIAKLLFSLTLVILIFFSRVNAQVTTSQEPKEYLDLPINIESPVEPTPVKAVDGKWYLVYHLFLTKPQS